MDINKKIKEMSSLTELKEIAKNISREEFLKKVINYNNDCPKIINLEDCGDHGICNTTPCYSCWENAIKDIKFKEDDCMEFNWNEFKKGEIVIHCDTKEKAINFLSECNLQNIKWVDKEYIIPTKCYFEKYETGIGYRFVPFESNEYCHGLTYDCLEFYETIGSNIIEWEIENKIDYDREYNIMRVMEFPEETEIKNQYNMFYKISNNDLYYKEDENRWVKSDICLRNILNMKFKLVKKDKKVDFMEAIKAFNEGKIIKVKYNHPIDRETITETYDSEYTFHNDITSYKILEGEWYIKED